MTKAITSEMTEPVDPMLVPNDSASPATSSNDLGDPIPAVSTWMLVAMWVIVYVAMTIVQGKIDWQMGLLGPGVINVQVAHEFGAMTALDVARGEVWRTITATFVHFSLLHLVCNLAILVALGRVLESWYGAAQFVVVYLIIGGLGNLIAVGGRFLFHGRLDNYCAGGSSVMFGLIALIAVVGWRSKTRFGDYVRRQMLGKLIFSGLVIGIIGRNVLDNYGHAGGAIAGALVGFSHRLLIKYWNRRWMMIAAGLASAIVLTACVAAQWRVGRREFEVARAERQKSEQAAKDGRRAFQLLVLDRAILRVIANYQRMALIIERSRGPFKEDPTKAPRHEIFAGLLEINATSEVGTPGGNEARYARWRKLAELAVARQPAIPEMREFFALSGPLVQDVQRAVLTAPGIRITPVPAPPRPGNQSGSSKTIKRAAPSSSTRK